MNDYQRKNYERNRKLGKTCSVCGERILDRNITGFCNAHRPQPTPKPHQHISIHT